MSLNIAKVQNFYAKYNDGAFISLEDLLRRDHCGVWDTFNTKQKKCCWKCNKGELTVVCRQTRSADEGMTTFLHCPFCKFTKKC